MTRTIPRFKIKVVKATNDELKLLVYEGDRIKAAIVAKRTRTKVKLAGFAEGELLQIGYCDSKSEADIGCVKQWVERAWEQAGLPGAEEVGEAVAEALKNWGHYTLVEEARRLYEEARSRPLLEKVDEEGRVVRVYATDGIERTTLGIIVVSGDCVAVSEGTLAEVEIEEEGEPVRRVKPIVVAVEHSNNIKTVWEVLDKDVAITLCGRPVVFRAGKLKEIDAPLQTLMHIETLSEILSGKISDDETWAKAGMLVLGELRRRLWFKDERVYYVLASFVLFTFFYDLFPTTPYLWFTGAPGSGKTHANFTVTFMSRHGIPLVEATKASIFRVADAFKPTLAVDESVIPRDVALVLAAGYKRGTMVPRAEPTKSGIKLAFFDPHSPKVFSYVDPPDDLMVLDRSIVINMVRGEPPHIETPDVGEFAHIRELLYKLRLLRIREVIEASKIANRILDEKAVKGRPRELWHPLLTGAVLIGQEAVENVISFMIDHLKSRTLPYDEEHKVLAVMEELYEEELGRRRLEALDPEKLIITFKASDITDRIVKMQLRELGLEPGDKLYEEKWRELVKIWNPRKVGRILHRLDLGRYQDRRGRSGDRMYTVPLPAFLDIAVRYEYEVPEEWLTFLKRSDVSQCQKCQPPSESITATSDETMKGVQEADIRPQKLPPLSSDLTRSKQVKEEDITSAKQLTGEAGVEQVRGALNHSERGGVSGVDVSHPAQDDVVGEHKGDVPDHRLTLLTSADKREDGKRLPNGRGADVRVLMDEAKAGILELLSGGYKLSLSELCGQLNPKLKGYCDVALRELAEKGFVEVKTVGDETWVWLKD
jgi:hypothetical protein